MPKPTEHALERFITAQSGVYETVLAELRAGKKRSHWMWFIFPQIDGLGTSSTARHFAIKSAREARKYLDHPVLGARLRECANWAAQLEGRTASEIFGYPDDLKFKSSMTLFHHASGGEELFQELLVKFYNGLADQRTLRILRALEAEE